MKEKSIFSNENLILDEEKSIFSNENLELEEEKSIFSNDNLEAGEENLNLDDENSNELDEKIDFSDFDTKKGSFVSPRVDVPASDNSFSHIFNSDFYRNINENLTNENFFQEENQLSKIYLLNLMKFEKLENDFEILEVIREIERSPAFENLREAEKVDLLDDFTRVLYLKKIDNVTSYNGLRNEVDFENLSLISEDEVISDFESNVLIEAVSYLKWGFALNVAIFGVLIGLLLLNGLKGLFK